jgi:hypothetical protein
MPPILRGVSFQTNFFIIKKLFQMKNSLMLLLSGLLFCTPSFSQTAAQEAIKKVCIAESQAVSDLDYEAYAACHVQTADEQLVYNTPNGTYGVKIGWDSISKTVKGWLKGGKKENVSKISGDNFTIVIHDDMAFAAYDGRAQKVADGKITRMRENRTLLYSAGQWKILAVQVFIDYPSGK